MTTKIKTTLLTTFLFFGLLTSLQAQDKYEFAVVAIDGFKVEVTTQTSKEKFAIEPKTLDFSVAVIRKVEEMGKEGWEVFSASPTSDPNGKVGLHVFYLRKKLKD